MRRTSRDAWSRAENGEPRWYTAQWNDDVHHVLHVAASGETKGYYADYQGRHRESSAALWRRASRFRAR